MNLLHFPWLNFLSVSRQPYHMFLRRYPFYHFFLLKPVLIVGDHCSFFPVTDKDLLKQLPKKQINKYNCMQILFVQVAVFFPILKVFVKSRDLLAAYSVRLEILCSPAAVQYCYLVDGWKSGSFPNARRKVGAKGTVLRENLVRSPLKYRCYD